MHVSYLSNPTGNSGWEKADLEVFATSTFNMHQNFVNIFFEPKFQHLVSLIQDNSLHIGEVNVSSFDMI